MYENNLKILFLHGTHRAGKTTYGTTWGQQEGILYWSTDAREEVGRIEDSRERQRTFMGVVETKLVGVYGLLEHLEVLRGLNKFIVVDFGPHQVLPYNSMAYPEFVETWKKQAGRIIGRFQSLEGVDPYFVLITANGNTLRERIQGREGRLSEEKEWELGTAMEVDRYLRDELPLIAQELGIPLIQIENNQDGTIPTLEEVLTNEEYRMRVK